MLFLPVLKGGFPRFFSLQEQMRVTVLKKKCGSVVLFLPVLKLGFPCFFSLHLEKQIAGRLDGLNSTRPSTHRGPLVPKRRAAVVRSTLNTCVELA